MSFHPIHHPLPDGISPLAKFRHAASDCKIIVAKSKRIFVTGIFEFVGAASMSYRNLGIRSL